MKSLPENPHSEARESTGGRSLPGRSVGLVQSFLAALVGVLPGRVLAQASDILKDARENLANVIEIGMWLLLAGGYVGAAYMIITGAIRLFQDREGGLARFALGVLVAIIMVVLMTYFVEEGQEQITNIRGS